MNEENKFLLEMQFIRKKDSKEGCINRHIKYVTQKLLIVEYINFLEKFSKSYSINLYNNFQKIKKEYLNIDDDSKKIFEEIIDTYEIDIDTNLEDSIFNEIEEYLVDKETTLAEERKISKKEVLELLKGHPIFMSFHNIKMCITEKKKYRRSIKRNIKRYNRHHETLLDFATNHNIDKSEVENEIKRLADIDK